MAKKKAEVPKVTVGEMKFTYNVPVAEKDIDTLERELDLASARYTFAIEQERHWREQVYMRAHLFNKANIAFRQAKHKFTDEEISGPVPVSSSAVWTYAK